MLNKRLLIFSNQLCYFEFPWACFKIKFGKKKTLPVAQKRSKMAEGAYLVKRAQSPQVRPGFLFLFCSQGNSTYKCIWEKKEKEKKWNTHTHCKKNCFKRLGSHLRTMFYSQLPRLKFCHLSVWQYVVWLVLSQHMALDVSLVCTCCQLLPELRDQEKLPRVP